MKLRIFVSFFRLTIMGKKQNKRKCKNENGPTPVQKVKKTKDYDPSYPNCDEQTKMGLMRKANEALKKSMEQILQQKNQEIQGKDALNNELKAKISALEEEKLDFVKKIQDLTELQDQQKERTEKEMSKPKSPETNQEFDETEKLRFLLKKKNLMIDNLKLELAEINQTCADLKAEKSSLIQEFKLQTQKNSDLLAEKGREIEALETLKWEFAEVNQICADLKAEKSSLIQEFKLQTQKNSDQLAEKNREIEVLKNKLEENQKEVDDLKVDNAVLKKEICSASQLDEELFANLQDTVNAKNQELAQLKTQVSSLASKLMDMVEPKN